MIRKVKIGKVTVGGGRLVLIAGPCVIEGRKACLDLAARLSDFARCHKVDLIFKASYDKANRSSIKSPRGPGMVEGLKILSEVKKKYGLPVLTDVHGVEQVAPVAQVVDVIQIPAFLCRQTDLLVEAGRSGKAVNVKKGQFMAPWDMKNVIDKIKSAGNDRIMITERGVTFGYNNLVSDMRSLLVMREYGYPVVYDATHSVQSPGGRGKRSGGDGKWAPYLARAAAAVGCNAVFMETHVNPAKALSDPDNAISLLDLKKLWPVLKKIHGAVSGK